MVSLREINEDNFKTVVGMKLDEEQSKYVASNVFPWRKPGFILKRQNLMLFIMRKR